MADRLRLIPGLILAVGLYAGPAAAQTAPPVVKQAGIGEMACGPCAILNMAAHGSEKLRPCVAALTGDTPEQRVRTLIDTHGAKPSTVYTDNRRRYTPGHGIALEELPGMVNDFLAGHTALRVAGAYLDRAKDEPADRHLRRVFDTLRKSLDAGIPPLIEVRSFAARPTGKGFLWEGLLGHFVTVVGLDAPGDGEKGFRFRFADSYSGRIETGYAAAEEARNFSATRGFSVAPDGKERYEWVTDYPYLLVTAPTLRLLTQREPWHTRTTIVLRHAVVEASAVPAKK